MAAGKIRATWQSLAVTISQTLTAWPTTTASGTFQVIDVEETTCQKIKMSASQHFNPEGAQSGKWNAQLTTIWSAIVVKTESISRIQVSRSHQSMACHKDVAPSKSSSTWLPSQAVRVRSKSACSNKLKSIGWLTTSVESLNVSTKDRAAEELAGTAQEVQVVARKVEIQTWSLLRHQIRESSSHHVTVLACLSSECKTEPMTECTDLWREFMLGAQAPS